MTQALPWWRQTTKAKPKCHCQKHTPCPCSGPLCRMSCAMDPRHGTLNGASNLWPAHGTRMRYRPSEGWRQFFNSQDTWSDASVCPWASGTPYPPPDGWVRLTQMWGSPVTT